MGDDHISGADLTPRGPRRTDLDIEVSATEQRRLTALVEILLPWRAEASDHGWTVHAFSTYGLFAALLLAVAGVHYLTGTRYSLLLLFGAPIVWAAWARGTAAGLILTALGCFAWVLANGGLYDLAAWRSAAARFAILGALAYVVSLQRALREALRRATRLARTDPLTGILNGRALDILAEREINRMRRNRRPLSLAYLDLDDFKAVNDSMGHHAGDAALKRVAVALKAIVREVDLIARVGGDEFVVLLPETDAVAAAEVIQRFHNELAAVTPVQGAEIAASVGLVTWVDPPASLDAMIRVADAQMYEAKRHGKGGVRHMTACGELVGGGPEAAVVQLRKRRLRVH
jgi:diguanylate cyclase (GGDEF)-like protein